MTRKILTAAAVRHFRPGIERRAIPDGAAPGLRQVVCPSGARSRVGDRFGSAIQPKMGLEG